MAAPKTNIIDDFLDSYPDGVDTNQATRQLPPTQLAAGFNLSLRGDFATVRPPFKFITIIDPSGVITALGGLYQGGCYYRPDAAPESLFVVVSGRLFQLTPDNAGNALLSEHTIPGDPNSATVPQAWLWQAENFLIVNDGLRPPTIFDGTKSFRSTGNAIVTVATIINNFTVPAVGSTVVTTISAPYNAPTGIAVTVNGQNYSVVSSSQSTATTYDMNITQTSQYGALAGQAGPFTTPNGFYAIIEAIAGNNGAGWAAWDNGSGPLPWPPTQAQLPIASRFLAQVTLSRPFTGALYTTLYLSSVNKGLIKVGVASISGGGKILQIVNLSNLAAVDIGVGKPIQGAQTITWTTVATPSQAFNIPAGAAAFDVFVGATSNVAPGTYVYFNASNGTQYEFIVNSFTTSATTTFYLTLQNVGDTPGNVEPAPVPVLYNAHMLPAGRMGTYGQGRVWMALPDGISFIGGDVVGSTSGTAQYNFRDAVLNVTQNVTLAGGINFRIPSSDDTIRAMRFTNTLDVSLGQGPLLVFTDKSIFSCQAPVDQTTWSTLTNPILTEALKGQGGKSQNAVVLSNADIIFRSNALNIRSFLLARMDYNQWGNTPISTEMIRFLKNDDPTLLTYASGIQFDNRMMMTVFPVQGQTGVFHRGMVVLNFDSISSLQGKAPSIWEGLWTGLQINQLFSGSFQNVERAFAFVFDTPCTTGQLYELLPEITPQIYDVSDYGPSSPVWGFETGDKFRGKDNVDSREFKALEDGAIAVDDVQGLVTFQVYYKTDQSPNWNFWRQFSKNVDSTLPNAQPGYFPQLGLGRPDELTSNDGFSNTNARFGYTFQFRVIITGHCRFLGGHLAASRQPEPEFPTPNSS